MDRVVETKAKNILPSKENITWLKKYATELAPLLGLILTVIVFAILTDGRSISSVNIKILLGQFMVTATVATGAVYSFSCGALDMSMGGSVALSAICGALAGLRTDSVVAMVLVTFLVAMAIALLKGTVAAYLKLPIFIVTIVFGDILMAIGLVLLGQQTVLSVSGLIQVKDPMMINLCILFGFYLICMIIFNYTKIGKSCKLQGGNITATTQKGINTKKNIITAFLISGVGVALAAIIILLRTKTASAATANTLGTDVMVAIVLGGMPLSGGPRSRISAGLIGAATITVLNNGLQIIGLSSGGIQIVRGIIFLTVVFITSMTYRTKLLPR